MIKVLIVDDSPTARIALRTVLQSDPAIHVVGEASNRREALAQIERFDPDLVTMDVFLRNEDGIEVTATIMQSRPRPILVVTGVNPKDPETIYRAIEAGALEVWPKPSRPGDAAYTGDRNRLVRLVKVLATVPVVHRGKREGAVELRRRQPSLGERPPTAGDAFVLGGGRKEGPAAAASEGDSGRIVVIGASTGGPPIVCSILKGLPQPFPLAIGVVQHMAAGFMQGFAQWLGDTTGHRVVVIRERSACLEPGTVYVAGDDRHMEFPSTKLVAPSDAPDRRAQRPSVDVLFESAAMRFGRGAIAVLLTGMGNDGAAGMLALRGAGAFTIAQEPSTCAVDAMPSSAMALRAVSVVARPDEIAHLLTGRSTCSAL